MSAELVAFLRVQLAEDAQIARAAAGTGTGRWTHNPDDVYGDTGRVEDERGEAVVYDEGAPTADEAKHIAQHDPARVLAEVEADRELLREYEQLLHAHEAHKVAVDELAADIEHEERTGRWEGVGSPDVRQRALRREADYLPAMLHVLGKWASAKAASYRDHPEYRLDWAPNA